MNSDELRSQCLAALEALDQSRTLLLRAIDLIDAEPPPASSLETQAEQVKGEDITLTGKIGRPQLTETSSGIKLWEAGLRVDKEEGGHRWINVQAWRKTAIYAAENLPSAAVATAVGRFEIERWTDDKGQPHEREKFVVKHFVEQK